jgi:3-dehydroquinate dehydratase II
MSKRVLIINGPNLGRLGKREPDIYGTTTLEALEQKLIDAGKALDITVECFQSNHEGAIIDRIEAATDAGTTGMILNAGAFTHTSVALMDAIRSSGIPTIEVHLSQIYRREEFRAHTITGKACIAVISGLGTQGYFYALDYLGKNL